MKSAVILAFVLAACPAFAGVFNGDWLELIDTTKLPLLREDATLQVSSYDRTGGNDDGFSGNYSFLRQEGDQYVIFEDEGPGCVYRIWSANPGQRAIEFYFDGEEIPRLVFEHWEDMFLGKVEPFVSPVSVHEIGGWTSYVPMPYEKSLKIITREKINFYQITYTKFADGDGVKTFQPEMTENARAKFERVCAAWNAMGEHPWSEAIASRESGSVVVQAGGSASLGVLDGPGIAHLLELTYASADAKLLRKAVLRINVDGGEPEVECPLGDFFLSPFPGETSQSLLCGVAMENPNRLYSYWPMPYRESITAEIANDSGDPLQIEFKVGYAPLDEWSDNLALFNARWLRQNPTTDGELYPILDARGRGHWCGVSIGMQGFAPGMFYLEGDEMLWIDDRDNTYYNGTGSEDYYNGGWYFGTTGSFPYYGCGYHNDGEGRCHAYRIHMADLVPWQRQARIGIEHGAVSDYPADYCGTTFWYATADTETPRPELPPVAERMWLSPNLPGYIEAESLEATGGEVALDMGKAHTYSGGEAVRVADTATLTFEVKEDDVYQVVLLVAGEGGPATAQVRLDGTPLQFERDVQNETESLTEAVMGKARLTKGAHTFSVKALEGNVLLDGIKLVASEKEPRAIEAEALPHTAVGRARIERRDGLIEGSSGDSFLEVTSPSTQAGIEFSWNADPSGYYAISVRIAGQAQVSVDGKPLVMVEGLPVGEPWTQPVLAGVTERLEAGERTLRLTGKHFAVDFLRIENDGAHEGEGLKVLEAKGGPIDTQGLGGFSAGAQAWFRPGSDDGYLVFEVPVYRPGRRNVYAWFCKAGDYGIYQLYIDGEPVGEPFDGFNNGVIRSERIDFGPYNFTEGEHEFRFDCIGKNKNSTGFMIGVDLIVLE